MSEKEKIEQAGAVKEEKKEPVNAGVHNYSTEDSYVPPKDPRIVKKLEWWKDQKLALMMHWGTYSQLGLVESWALSDADADWSRNCIDWQTDGETFKKEYTDLNKSFNPIRFEPEKWASLAKEGGFKYLIFTTKHHDGFCMYDSQYTDYKVTGKDCPFHTHRYADICANLFAAFRHRGMGIAAYFSKADWNTPYYWAKDTERGNFMWRGPSYKPEENPELWEKFVQFTHNQVLELVQNYGKIDVLWFDAGWVCDRSGQDIRIEELIKKARKIQPWVLSADRTCGGICENYVTPEQCVPDKPLNIPWESCVTMGTSFSFGFDDTYKSVRQLIHLLIDIVAKGGNLALNVGPQPDGRLPRHAIDRIKGMGKWLKQYGVAIYGTRVCEPFRTGDFAFTQKEAEGKIFAFHLYKSDDTPVPEQIVIPIKRQIKSIKNLSDGNFMEFSHTGEGISVRLQASNCGNAPIAEVFEIEV